MSSARNSRFPSSFSPELVQQLLDVEKKIPDCKVFVVPTPPTPPSSTEIKLLGSFDTKTAWNTWQLWFPHLFGSQLMPPVTSHFFGCGNFIILEPRKGVTLQAIDTCGREIHANTKQSHQRIGKKQMKEFLRYWNRYILPGESVTEIFIRWGTSLTSRFGSEFLMKLMGYCTSQKLPGYTTHLVFMHENKVIQVVEVIEKYDWQDWMHRNGLYWHVMMPSKEIQVGFTNALKRLNKLTSKIDQGCIKSNCDHKEKKECPRFLNKVTEWYEALDRYNLSYSDDKELPKYQFLSPSKLEEEEEGEEDDEDVELFVSMEWSDLTEIAKGAKKDEIISCMDRILPSCTRVITDLEKFFV